MSHLIFSIVLIGLVVCLIIYLGQRNHRCRWCRCRTLKITHLDDPDRSNAHALIFREQMGSTSIESYDFCPSCRRIFDWRWFKDDRDLRQDWDMYDRRCQCGSDLRRPLYNFVPREEMIEAMERMRPEAVTHMRSTYSPGHIASINTSITIEDHVFFICPRCRRIYMWMPLESFQVFQCVTEGCDLYDAESTDPYAV